ncbi:MAG: GntR family transcriptional regulator [Puniceicoccales bacterium]
MKKSSVLPKFELTSTEPLYRQIARHIRTHILSGQIPVGTKLPSIRQLASEAGTSVFSIQKALDPLFRDGLIGRNPRSGSTSGTTVLSQKVKLTSIAVYFGNLIHSGEGQFYQALYSSIFQQLIPRGVEVHLLTDHRKRNQQGTPSKKLLQAIQNHEIQAVIASMLYPSHFDWLRDLEVPVAMHASTSDPRCIRNDPQEFLLMALEQFQRRGVRRISLIPQMIETQSETTAESMGMEMVQLGKEELSKYQHTTWDQKGYQIFHEIWKQPRRPEGIFVYPDSSIPGIVYAIKELGIRVPEELKVIAHRNKGVNLFYPLKSDEIIMDIDEIAARLIQTIDLQLMDQPLPVLHVSPLLKPGY